MIKFGEDTIKATMKMIEEQLRGNLYMLDKAYMKAEGTMKVDIGASYALNKKEGGMDVTVTMSFVLEKVKETSKMTVVEGQERLFDVTDGKTEEITEDYKELVPPMKELTGVTVIDL